MGKPCRKEDTNMVRKINSDEFKELLSTSEKPMIVDFYANWCVPCKMMAPVVSQVAEENRETILVAKIDIEENPDIALEYRVLSIPALLFIKGGEVIGRIEGIESKTFVDQKIKKYFSE